MGKNGHVEEVDDDEPPCERIEAYLDEAQELLDESEVVADKEVPADTRKEFRSELGTAASSLREAHAKVKGVLKRAKGVKR